MKVCTFRSLILNCQKGHFSTNIKGVINEKLYEYFGFVAPLTMNRWTNINQGEITWMQMHTTLKRAVNRHSLAYSTSVKKRHTTRNILPNFYASHETTRWKWWRMALTIYSQLISFPSILYFFVATSLDINIVACMYLRWQKKRKSNISEVIQRNEMKFGTVIVGHFLKLYLGCMQSHRDIGFASERHQLRRFSASYKFSYLMFWLILLYYHNFEC